MQFETTVKCEYTCIYMGPDVFVYNYITVFSKKLYVNHKHKKDPMHLKQRSCHDISKHVPGILQSGPLQDILRSSLKCAQKQSVRQLHVTLNCLKRANFISFFLTITRRQHYISDDSHFFPRYISMESQEDDHMIGNFGDFVVFSCNFLTSLSVSFFRPLIMFKRGILRVKPPLNSTDHRGDFEIYRVKKKKKRLLGLKF